jgi:hypothetical protein
MESAVDSLALAATPATSFFPSGSKPVLLKGLHGLFASSFA